MDVRAAIRRNKIWSAALIAVLFAALWFGFALPMAYLPWGAGPWGGNLYFLLATTAFPVLYIGLMLLLAVPLSLRHVHGRQANPNDAAEAWVTQEVQLLSRQAGIPEPTVVVGETMDVNAFAMGIKRSNTYVGVTAGALAAFDEDEMRAVLAHEVGHILHRDVFMKTLAAAALGLIDIMLNVVKWIRRGAAGVAVTGAAVGTYARRSEDRELGTVLAGVGLVVILVSLFVTIGFWISRAFAKVAFYAMSRQQEYAADAASARLTRNPDALRSAFATIESTEGHFVGRRKDTDAMYFAHTKLGGLFNMGLLATHPSFERRVSRLARLRIAPPRPSQPAGQAVQQRPTAHATQPPATHAAPPTAPALRCPGCHASVPRPIGAPGTRARVQCPACGKTGTITL